MAAAQAFTSGRFLLANKSSKDELQAGLCPIEQYELASEPRGTFQSPRMSFMLAYACSGPYLATVCSPEDELLHVCQAPGQVDQHTTHCACRTGKNFQDGCTSGKLLNHTFTSQDRFSFDLLVESGQTRVCFNGQIVCQSDIIHFRLKICPVYLENHLQTRWTPSWSTCAPHLRHVFL